MPRDQLYQRKVPVMLTDAQVEWLDEFRFSNRFEGRSEAIRSLIDQAREQSPTTDQPDGPLARASDETALPEIRPYAVEDYPGQGFAPRIVAFIRRDQRRSYTNDEIVTETGLQTATLQPGQRASIATTMKTLGYKPTVKRLPGKPAVHGWEYG
jgi:Arc/MetJ-type ribon-helix-helix transcriptional regulator